MLLTRREDPLPYLAYVFALARRQSTASQSRTSSSGPFTTANWCPTCPSVPASPLTRSSQAHLTHVSSLSAWAPARIRPVMRRPSGGGAGPTAPGFPAAFSAVGLGLLGHPVPAGELSLPHGRPTRHHVTGPQRGCRVAHEQAATGQGALLIPGTVVRSWLVITLLGGDLPLALPRPVPTAPLEHPICGGHFHETSTESSRYSPITPGPAGYRPQGREPCLQVSRRSSPRPRPPDGTRAARLLLGLRTPQLPATHAEVETGHHALAQQITPSTSAEPPNGASHLTQAPSRRT